MAERSTPKNSENIEDRYQLLFSSSPNPVWICDTETMAFLEVNAAAIDKYGYSEAEFLAATVAILRPDDNVATMQQLSDDLRPGIPYFALRQHHTKSGAIIDVEVTAYAFIWEGKQANLVQIKDVTSLNQLKADRQQSEEDLYSATQQIALIWESMSDAYVMLDRDWHFVYVNAAAAKLWNIWANISPDAILGKDHWLLLPQALSLPIEPPYRRAMTKQVPVNFEFFDPITSEWFEVHAYPSIVGLGVYLRNISQRKQREIVATSAIEQIREQADLLDIASDAIYVCDLEYQILYWSKGAERLYGWSRAEAMGQIATELMQENSIQVAKMLKNLLGKGSGSGEIRKITQAGTPVIVDGRWTLVNEAGRPKSILIVDTDITEKKQLETQFLRAQRLESLGTLASGIAHDLNNVLTPIIGITQLLPITIPDLDEKSERLLKILDESAHRGADLVKQILAFAHGVERESSSTEVARLLTEIQDVIQQTFPKNVKLSVNLPDNLWTIAADATLLHQVFMNLCVNANDAMPHGGQLSIIAENLSIDANYAQMHVDAKVGQYVVVTIGDTGMGILPQIMDLIFDPFFTTKEVGKGTGLGLSTVIGIIKSHAGFIDVYSEVGKGTRFKVYLPVADLPEMLAITPAKPPRGNGELILVVDDELAVQEITQATLEAYNYQAITAGDGIDAIALYAQNPDIKVILLDLMMPNLDAITTIRILRKLNPDVPIIAMSGLATNELAMSTAYEGAQSFLAKPFTASVLINMVARVSVQS
jgi:two-component system, cell cycle sensor histidine kinase and response regulator CckA